MSHYYIYRPLQPREIRVIKLLPSQTNAPLDCEIVHISLASAVKYTALSYVWGSDEKTHTLKAREGFVRITASLHAALTRLRSRDSALTIWADAVSINQSNNVEKSAQVALMKDIYQQAANVVSYLGHEADGSHLVPPLLRQLTGVLMEGAIDRTLRPGTNGLPPDADPAWTALTAFLRRPWFRRAWIVQEFVVNTENHMVCGAWTERGEVVANVSNKAMSILMHLFRDEPNLGRDRPEYVACFQLRGMRLARAMFAEGAGLELRHLLSNFGRAEATRARDHLFAFQSLACERDDPALYPDYDEPLESVMRRYTYFLISRYQSLDFLSLAGLSAHSFRFSSWTPDFTKSLVTRTSLVGRSGSDAPPFRAGGPASNMRVYRDMFSADALFVAGAPFDMLTQVGREVAEDREDSDIANPMREFERLIASLYSYPSGEDLAAVERRTLTGDLRSCDEGIWSQVKQMLKLEGARRKQAYVAIDDEYPNVTTAILKLITERRCCLTQSGLVGFVPASARVGDVVLIPYGGKVPLVLRPGDVRENAFRLVGDCYLHGIMYGEFVASGMSQGMDIRLL